MQTIDALSFGLAFETKGAMTYLEYAKKTANPLGKHLFYTLAMQEIEHAKRIDEFFSKQQRSQTPAAEGSLAAASVEREMKAFVQALGRESARRDLDNVSIYSLAMELERTGYRTYERYVREAGSAAEKEFFGFLLSEEKNHLESIANVYAYLTGSGDWLQQDESRTWNWMNL